MHRADTLITDKEDQNKEKKYVSDVLKDNAYKSWVIKAPKKKNNRNEDDRPVYKNDRSYAIPYVRGTSEKLHKIYKRFGIKTHHKPFNKLRDILVHPKDPIPKEQKCGVIYQIDCSNCPSSYVGETYRPLSVRVQEHQQPSRNTAVCEHIKEKKHKIEMKNVKILASEKNMMRRKNHEAIFIHQLKPALNRDSGTQLPPIYNDLLKQTGPRSQLPRPLPSNQGIHNKQ